jgi:ubiquinone/menaquinone biosynthesis C-methylase UbiE
VTPLWPSAHEASPGQLAIPAAKRAGLCSLVQAFRAEQRDPDRFYRLLAADTVALVGDLATVPGARVLDVGSGPGDLAEAFRHAGAWAVAVDVDWEEMHCRERRLELAVLGDGTRLPFGAQTFDLTCSSNVLEHVPDPLALLADMVRVTRPGGVVFVNYTLWTSPWGGHETAPWHFVGGAWAMRRYERRTGRSPKNRFGISLFPIAGRRFLRQVRQLPGAVVVDAFPRYYPRWTRRLVEVPGVGDLLTWNLAIVLRCEPGEAPAEEEPGTRGDPPATCRVRRPTDRSRRTGIWALADTPVGVGQRPGSIGW